MHWSAKGRGVVAVPVAKLLLIDLLRCTGPQGGGSIGRP